ncbi:MAG: acyl-CoA thioesterase [Sandaracinaceae bacterium]
MPTLSAFDRARAFRRVADDRTEGTLSEDWFQGRGVYGGLLSALLLDALTPLFEEQALRTLHVSFLAPALAGEASVGTEVERAGRSIGTGLARLTVGDTPVARATATFAKPRRSTASELRTPGPALPAPSALPDGPEALYVPAFCQHLEFRQAVGPAPFSGSDVAHLGGWCRFREPPALEVAMLVALADAWPPAALTLSSRWRAAASVDLTFQMLGPLPEVAHDAFWGFEARASVVEGGYADETATLFTRNGTAVASIRQFVALFG